LYGDFEIDDIVKNTSKTLKEFLNIKETDYDDLNIQCPKDKEIRNIWLLPSDKVLGKTKPFVDYQNDATAKDIKLALREGLDLLNMLNVTQQQVWVPIKVSLVICMH